MKEHLMLFLWAFFSVFCPIAFILTLIHGGPWYGLLVHGIASVANWSCLHRTLKK